MFSKTSYHIEISQLICKANWYVMSKIAKQSMSGYYVWRMLSFNHGWHSFYCPKIISRKIDKEAIKLFKLHLLLYVKNWPTFHHFFHLSSWKVLNESVLFFIVKYLMKMFYYLSLIVTTYHWLVTPKSTL